MSFDINDLVLACDGAEKDGSTKCGISISNEFWFPNRTTMQISHRDLIDPVVGLYQHSSYVQVDLDFGSENNPELATCWNLLESMQKIAMDAPRDGRVPVTTLSIIPLQYQGEYSFLGVGAIFWSLQPPRVGMSPSVIRMIFNLEDFVAQHLAPGSSAKIDYMEEMEANKAQTLSDIEQYRAAMAQIRVPATEETPEAPDEKPKAAQPEAEYEDEEDSGF